MRLFALTIFFSLTFPLALFSTCHSGFALFLNSDKELTRLEWIPVFERITQFKEEFDYVFSLPLMPDIEEAALRDFIKENDQLVQQIQEKLATFGVSAKKVKHELVLDQYKVHYSALKFETSAKYSVKEFELLRLFKKKTKVKSLEMDFLGNHIQHSLGYFQPSTSTISLSDDILEDAFLRKLTGTTVWHEFKHAAFERLRTLRQDSIYHFSWYPDEGKELPGNSLYKEYMSGEEFYNFVNELVWTLKDGFEKLGIDDQKILLKYYQGSHAQAEALAAQLKILCDDSLLKLQMLSKESTHGYGESWHFDEETKMFMFVDKTPITLAAYSQSSSQFLKALKMDPTMKTEAFHQAAFLMKQKIIKEQTAKLNRLKVVAAKYLELSQSLYAPIDQLRFSVTFQAETLQKDLERLRNRSREVVNFIREKAKSYQTY